MLPLVPGYLSAVTGVSANELENASWRRVLGPSLLFVASFSAIFILLGLTATGLGSVLQDHKDLLTKISGALIIAMGLLFVGSLFITRLNKEWHVDALLERAGKEARSSPERPSRPPGARASARRSARSSAPRPSPTRPPTEPSSSLSTQLASPSPSSSPPSPSPR